MKKHSPRKRFGQHFLVDDSIVNAIVSSIAPTKGQHLIEIGPGEGALTTALLAEIPSLEVIELDRDIIPLLKKNTQSLGTLLIHQEDVLRVDFRQLKTSSEKLRIVGNLPYNISTPLLFHLIDQRDVIHDMLFMLQKEVVDRLGAPPGNKVYGRLSVMAQYFCEIHPLFDVPPESFNPPPKVESAVIRMTPHSELPSPAYDYEHFAAVVKQAFSQRRKTLSNSLASLVPWQIILKAGIDPGKRPEQLSVADFVAISNTQTATPLPDAED
jgi:16S rRNA (adenine1518-N6/adenine1519-N6)-dimethyltransferase